MTLYDPKKNVKRNPGVVYVKYPTSQLHIARNTPPTETKTHGTILENPGAFQAT